MLTILGGFHDLIHAQEERIAIQDAFILSKVYTANNKEPIKFADVEDFLTYYFKEGADIENELNDNPFLSKYIKGSGTASVSEASKRNMAGATTGSIAGLDVTNIVRGIANFMISRAKEELTVSFFERFKDFASENPEFKVLFPKTTKTLDRLLAVHYTEMLPTLRTAFHEDLDAVIDHLDDVLELEKYKDQLAHHPEIRITVKAIQLFPALGSGDNPAELLSDFSKLKEWDEIDNSSKFKNVEPTVKLANIISQSLRSRDEDRIWVNRDSLNKLYSDQVAFELYIGLIFQLTKKEDITFFTSQGPLSLYDKFKTNNSDGTVLIQNLLAEFYQLCGKIEKIKKTLEEKGRNREDYFSYIVAGTDFFEFSFNIAVLVDKNLALNAPLLLIQDAIDLYKNIYFEEYGQAILEATDLLKHFRETFDPQNQSGLDKIIDKSVKYGLFMANMVEAESPEQVEALIESVVLPVGSSSIKKHSTCNISVQSYLGAYYLIDGPTNGFITSWNDTYGVHAPIGLSISTGLGKVGSLGVFGSLLDLGAIVDYELALDTIVNPIGSDEVMIEKDYKIELGQIFSPGAYIVYGFPFNLPLALGVGGQHGPGLSKIETDGRVIVNDSKWRWNVFLSVDIPFFTIFNKSKRE